MGRVAACTVGATCGHPLFSRSRSRRQKTWGGVGGPGGRPRTRVPLWGRVAAPHRARTHPLTRQHVGRGTEATRFLCFLSRPPLTVWGNEDGGGCRATGATGGRGYGVAQAGAAFCPCLCDAVSLGPEAADTRPDEGVGAAEAQTATHPRSRAVRDPAHRTTCHRLSARRWRRRGRGRFGPELQAGHWHATCRNDRAPNRRAWRVPMTHRN